MAAYAKALLRGDDEAARIVMSTAREVWGGLVAAVTRR
jgi:hypothetical protein